MPQTLSPDDPNLLAGVGRLRRVQQIWGWLLIGLGAVTQFAAGAQHPVSGLPFIAIGVFCIVWGDPALLAAVATLVAISILPTINARLTILGPDPLARSGALSTVELIALVLGKLLIVVTAANQFSFYRFLYGTERATSDVPDLDIIPPLVPNRTNGLARSARWAALIGAACSTVALLSLTTDPTGRPQAVLRLLAEVGGNLGAVAIGLGLGCAFSPTDERPAALLGVGLGLVGNLAAIGVLLSLLGV